MAIKFYRAKALPSPLTAAHDGVWHIKPDGADSFRTFNVKNGVAVGDAFDSLTVGGRNLLPSFLNNKWNFSNDAVIVDPYTLTHAVPYTRHYNTIKIDSEGDTLYTFSGHITGLITIYESDSNENRIGTIINYNPIDLITFRTQVNTRILEIVVSVISLPNGEYEFSNLKLEKGNKATDWTPAPEDLVTDWNETNADSFSFLKNKPTSFPPSSHTHPISQVIGLQSGLDGKENSFTKNTAFNKNFGSASGTVTEGNDSRLSNSREWTADTISQAEAEAGTATTRRAWTAQRVRQSVVAWWNNIKATIAEKAWVSANFDKYTKWNLKTNGIQRKGITSENEVDFVAGDNVNIDYGAGGQVNISAFLGASMKPTLSQVTEKGNVSAWPVIIRAGAQPSTPVAELRDYALILGTYDGSGYSGYFGHYLEIYTTAQGTRRLRLPFFPYTSGTNEYETYIPVTVNGVRAGADGNIEVLFPQIIEESGVCHVGITNNCRYIIRTNEVCLQLGSNGADEGKEFIVINDSGNAVDVSVSSSKFYKPHNGLLPRPIINSFPTGYVGRFRVISGEMVEIG